MLFDRVKPESPLFDKAEVPSMETFFGHYRGLRIAQEDPLVVEVYSDQIFPDAETIAGTRAGYLFTSTPWRPAWPSAYWLSRTGSWLFLPARRTSLKWSG